MKYPNKDYYLKRLLLWVARTCISPQVFESALGRSLVPLPLITLWEFVSIFYKIVSGTLGKIGLGLSMDIE